MSESSAFFMKQAEAGLPIQFIYDMLAESSLLTPPTRPY
jgi:hypothetical protein